MKPGWVIEFRRKGETALRRLAVSAGPGALVVEDVPQAMTFNTPEAAEVVARYLKKCAPDALELVRVQEIGLVQVGAGLWVEVPTE